MTFGRVTVDSNGDCDSSEIDELCKGLPKLNDKIVVDARTIEVNICLPGTNVVDAERPHCILDPNEEFRKRILSRFAL